MDIRACWAVRDTWQILSTSWKSFLPTAAFADFKCALISFEDMLPKGKVQKGKSPNVANNHRAKPKMIAY